MHKTTTYIKGAALALAASLSMPALANPGLDDLTLMETQSRLKSGELTLKQLSEHYIDRIEKHDKNGATINSVAYINPFLEARINQLQSKLKSGQPLGSMFGAFILVKDNVDIKGMPNTAGAYIMREHKPGKDAYVIARLRAEDAIILGKANLSEWANFRSTRSSSGWSSLYGQSRNPHDNTRSTCGSSAGSGAAVAADFALMAVGTETDGSVVCPSAVNGVVGIKPTIGLVSRSGIIPISHSQDTAGPMARTVTDAVMMLDAMMGKDPADKAALDPIPLVAHLKADGLKGKRIGVVRNLMGYHPDMDAVFEAQLDVLKAAGATIVDDLEFAHKGDWGQGEYQVLLSEFKVDLNAYFEQSGSPVKSLKHAMELNEATKERSLPIFGHEIFEQAEKTNGLNDEAYIKARADSVKYAAELGIDALLKEHSLDLLISPTVQPAWKIDHILGDHYLGGASSAAAIAGYPHITVPMGTVRHLPVGMSFFSTALKEGTLIEAAYAFEQATKARVRPNLSQPAARE